MEKRFLSALLAMAMVLTLMPGTVFAAAGQAKETPSSNQEVTGGITMFGFRAINPPLLGLDDPTRIMWISLSRDRMPQGTDYEIKVTGPDEVGEFTPEILGYGSVGFQPRWQMSEEQLRPGKYTVSATKDGKTATATLELVKLNFHVGNGESMSGPTSIYAWVSDSLSKIAPTVTGGQGPALRGWSQTQVQPDEMFGNQTLVTKVPADEKGTRGEIDLYAVMGPALPSMWEITGTDQAGDVLQEEATATLGNLIYGYTKADSKNFTITNKSSSKITFRALNTTSSFEIRLDKAEIEAGGTATLTVTPKMGLKAGVYTETLILNSNSRPIGFSLRLNLTVDPLTVTVKPQGVEKPYGKSMTAADVTCTIENDASRTITAADLGLSIQCGGFAATAAARETAYPYTITSSTDGNIKVNVIGEGRVGVTVTRAKPIATGVYATGIRVGAQLSTSQLTGTFVNPNQPDWAVEGDLTWTKDQQMNQPGTRSMSWTFTPKGGNAANYSVTTGSVNVEVSAKDPTNMTLDSAATTFVYDGQPHGLSFSADREGDIAVQYKKQDGSEGAWTSEPPKDAGTYDVKAAIAETDQFAANSITVAMTIEQADPAGTVTVGQIPMRGGVLSDSQLTHNFTGVEGEMLVGNLHWNEVGGVTPGSITVEAGTRYTWTFVPENANYKTVTGSATVPFAPDTGHDDPSNRFTDVNTGLWYCQAVDYMLKNGMMNGTSATTFSPMMATTRGMIMIILARTRGVDTTGSIPWYQVGMDWAVGQGVSDGNNPEAVITREQIATMLWRCASSPAADYAALGAFPDGAAISTWAMDGMAWAVEKGIITGTGSGLLNAGGSATRVEAATMLMRFCKTTLPISFSRFQAPILPHLMYLGEFYLEIPESRSLLMRMD